MSDKDYVIAILILAACLGGLYVVGQLVIHNRVPEAAILLAVCCYVASRVFVKFNPYR